jgi:hypothetical protein
MIVKQKDNEITKVAEAIKEIVLKDFRKKSNNFHFVTAVEEKNSRKTQSLVNAIIVKVQGKMTVQITEYTAMKIPLDERRRYSVIMIIDSFESFMKFNEKLIFNHFKLRRNFVFLFLGEFSRKISEVNEILWEKLIVHSNSVTVEKEEIIMFTFVPFEKNKC